MGRLITWALGVPATFFLWAALLSALAGMKWGAWAFLGCAIVVLVFSIFLNWFWRGFPLFESAIEKDPIEEEYDYTCPETGWSRSFPEK